MALNGTCWAARLHTTMSGPKASSAPLIAEQQAAAKAEAKLRAEARAAAKKHVILFLAANPRDTDRLALDREARSIHLELKRSGYRDRFDFVTRWAVEPLDLLRVGR